MRLRPTLAGALGLAILGLTGVPAHAGSHNWRFNEVFSNFDGSIMFIEMKECCGTPNEIALNGKVVQSDSPLMQFFFPGPLTGNTANRNLLLGTPGFAAQAGAPTPDYIIQPNFLNVAGGTLRYHTYPAAIWNHGAIPTDGIQSLRIPAGNQTNSPTNYAGQTGTISAPCLRQDTDNNGVIDVDDIVNAVLDFGAAVITHGGDVNFDGVGDIDDIVDVVVAFGQTCP